MISIKLPAELDRALRATARRRGVSQSVVVREALELSLSTPETVKRRSLIDRAPDLVGAATGPRDLSTNRAYLDDLGQ